ncbi:hypothetical protein C446_10600 [Halobiforma nitratireducens JCM 10879]|uniref:Uncharacterized protein n=1 Tax=Halobiforma nitratireducens JCM 10879 TaxID=1227454 RepID=M0LZR5_9EURY|nr:hypothetical protein C446_10600 [Halobiforma nitratireducens JCM 10879]
MLFERTTVGRLATRSFRLDAVFLSAQRTLRLQEPWPTDMMTKRTERSVEMLSYMDRSTAAPFDLLALIVTEQSHFYDLLA